MTYIKSVFVFLLLSLSSLAALAMPSVADVEATISSGDYDKAKEQLKEVLNKNPNSYVANRYMLEIIKIENARDNVASVGYKIYEDKLAQIEAVKAAKVAAIKKAEEEKRAAERSRKFKEALWVTVKFFGSILLIGSCITVALIFKRRLEFKHELEKQQKARREWKHVIRPDLIDLNQILTEAIDSPRFQGTDVLNFLKDLYADNIDFLRGLENDDFDEAAIKRHIRNAIDYLDGQGVSV